MAHEVVHHLNINSRPISCSQLIKLANGVRNSLSLFSTH